MDLLVKGKSKTLSIAKLRFSQTLEHKVLSEAIDRRSMRSDRKLRFTHTIECFCCNTVYHSEGEEESKEQGVIDRDDLVLKQSSASRLCDGKC